MGRLSYAPRQLNRVRGPYVDADLWREVKVACAEDGVPVWYFLKQALAAALAARRSKEEKSGDG